LRTLKRFTESCCKAVFLITLLALLNACVSQSDRPASMSSASVDPKDQNVDVAVAGGTSNEALQQVIPLPDVTDNNVEVFERALALIREDRFDDAEILLLEITIDQPELAGPWINLGQIYAAREQDEEARMAFERAIEANPWNCTAHNELGVLSRQNGDFENAERHYLMCIERVPSFKDAYLNLGILYELYLGKLTQALDSYRTYQSLLSEPDRRVQGWVMDLERRLGV
jgi:tetratricopeptide (TPR) repeat protein